MCEIVIGTAGHVDHGKTLLIKALTGIDADRLSVEKKRGLTTDIGYAHISCNGKKYAIIDVPGHAGYLSNMLDGIFGINLVLLVVDAVEGFQQQTYEHLQIINGLGIMHGIVVLNKIDLLATADDLDGKLKMPDEKATNSAFQTKLAKLKADMGAKLLNTTLAEAPIISVSGRTGVGIAELKVELQKLLRRMEAEITGSRQRMSKECSAHNARLYIDRVFTKKGYGNVVTGRLWGDKLCVGDTLMLNAGKDELRVKNLEVLGEKVNVAGAGSRVALNLAEARTAPQRGDCLSQIGAVTPSNKLDVVLWPFAPDAYTDMRRVFPGQDKLVHFHAFTCKKTVKLHYYSDVTSYERGRTYFAQLRFQEDLCLAAGDRFIISSFSPKRAVMAGQILDVLPQRQTGDEAKTKLYKLYELYNSATVDDSKRLLQLCCFHIRHANIYAVDLHYLCAKLSRSAEFVQKLLAALADTDKDILRLPLNYCTHASQIAKLKVSVKELLQQKQKQSTAKGEPFGGLSWQACAEKTVPYLPLQVFAAVKDLFKPEIVEINGKFFLPKTEQAGSQQSERTDKLLAEIMSLQNDNIFAPLSVNALVEKLGQEKRVRAIWQNLIDGGDFVYLGEGIAFAIAAIAVAQAKLVAYLQQQQSISLGEFRDLCGTTRKHALLLLNYFDRQKLTTFRDGQRYLCGTKEKSVL